MAFALSAANPRASISLPRCGHFSSIANPGIPASGNTHLNIGIVLKLQLFSLLAELQFSNVQIGITNAALLHTGARKGSFIDYSIMPLSTKMR